MSVGSAPVRVMVRSGGMARNPVNTEELENVLDGLGDDVTDPQMTAPGPPPLTAKVRAVASKLPMKVEELFILDASSSSPPRGGPDQKLEFFRQRVKVLEERFGQIKEAWSAQIQQKGQVEGQSEKVRVELQEKLDEQSRAAEEAQAQSADAAEKLKALQEFLNQKKAEFDAYGKSVAEAFTEKEKEKDKIRTELSDAVEDAASLRDEVKALKRIEKDLRQEMDGRTDALKKQLSRAEADAKRKMKTVEHELDSERAAQERRHSEALKERDLEVRAEVQAATRAETALAETELNEQIEILREKLREAKTSAQGLHNASQNVEELQRDLDLRDDAIDKLKGSLKDFKKRLNQKEIELSEVGSSSGPAALDRDKHGKLQRAVEYAAKVITAAHKGQISKDQRAEVFKRASRAIQTVQELIGEL